MKDKSFADKLKSHMDWCLLNGKCFSLNYYYLILNTVVFFSLSLLFKLICVSSLVYCELFYT